MNTPIRFWLKVNQGGGPEACWPWLGTRATNGYGRFWYQGRMRPAHRMAWAFAHGQMFPGDMDACHTCDNPPCCNPAHVFPGTPSDNARDSIAKGRFYFNRAGLPRSWQCRNGHPMDELNAGIRAGGRGRFCRACKSASQRRWYVQKKIAAAYTAEGAASEEAG